MASMLSLFAGVGPVEVGDHVCGLAGCGGADLAFPVEEAQPVELSQAVVSPG